ncbi:sulfotransferase [Planktothrix agardhii]|uniref:sulfotransferase n=1 Tax=Planktothrix agardhii TaxID=1160 RepID=UPI001D0A41F6|nr:sulfotransferase [Planktothrix agardhii]MCB8788545.1 sulfotransferase [Planktothrix agardhii 1025]MCF3612488.1 sulfotransferase [Planktothrix agardhii 1027]MCF3646366.1 sulfotransferase [Planktothrix agardhii 1026]
MQKSHSEQTVFIITGMHRSGTSLTASILQSAGVHIGRNLLGADHVNIKGHFENIDFYQFHINILDSQGVSGAGWTLQDNLEIKEEFIDQAKDLVQKNALSSVWGWKEPRTTLFLEFWAKLLPEAKFLLIYRSPWEVADSLYRRGDEMFQSQPELAIKYWQHYNQKILNFYNREQHRCLLTNLKTIVQYQNAYIDTINHKFNVDLSHPAPTAYDPSLLRTEISSNSQRPTLIDHYFPEAIELYQELEGRGWHPEQTPDFSWQELLKPTLYKTWAFQEWVNLRQLEIENKSLKSQLQEEKVELEEAKAIQAEAEQTKTQLKTAESLLEQSQSQLQETESVLQQFQTQLSKTESVLQQSHIQEDLKRSESQLHEAEAQRNEFESILSQLTIQLQQAQKREERFQIQLHQSLEELEKTQIKLQQDQDNLQESNNQVKQLKRDLKRSTSQLYQVQSEFDLSHSQLQQSESQLQQTQTELTEIKSQFEQTKQELEQKQTYINELETSVSQLEQTQTELTEIKSKFQETTQELEQKQTYINELETSVSQLEQTQTELTEIKSQFQETKRELKQKQAQVNQLQTELKRSQSQMYQLQIELAQSQLQIQQIQERQQLEQSLSNDPKKHTEMDYNLLIWDAWNAYRNGKLLQMKAHLQKALKLTTASPSEIILTWLESFSKLSLAQGIELDSESLTNSEEWQQLVRQMTAKKGVNLTEKSIKQAINQVAVETATQAKPADAG